MTPERRRGREKNLNMPYALFVDDEASILDGISMALHGRDLRILTAATPHAVTRCAMRWVRTRVLPDPAPATTSTGPSVARTASRCAGLRPAR